MVTHNGSRIYLLALLLGCTDETARLHYADTNEACSSDLDCIVGLYCAPNPRFEWKCLPPCVSTVNDGCARIQCLSPKTYVDPPCEIEPSGIRVTGLISRIESCDDCAIGFIHGLGFARPKGPGGPSFCDLALGKVSSWPYDLDVCK